MVRKMDAVQDVSGSFAYQEVVQLSGQGNSDWILIPSRVSKITVTLVVENGATAKVQTSTNTINEIKDNHPDIVAIDWDHGEVSTNTQDSCDPVTAIRLVQTSANGNSKLYVRAQ